ncbi:conserved protein of unknown function [Xenorhabdus doucetiae]|uniref:Uncharacterized protein n=1 Tax=Xenorhabdus doucetiae TaxID=351671 RepID=A0A068QQ70_9GAMM|nr:conserved protein of unknown function [Xenorhabdus doucetiae]CEE94502.1 hypothetical protein XNA1_4690011 [Xenorhabdus nematophila str. Anatoliense]CEF31815.1 hypothetical protein XNW1_410021 [Xenorhabdus nematophila str. Websteri]CEK22273.1 hypothetical protein XNC2_1279 [Xenorhabdus nematophila AN6/1]CEE95502.1 hypothetical protein XNA1_530011 [Xenorhabdus nematophila str. Anatoliense]
MLNLTFNIVFVWFLTEVTLPVETNKVSKQWKVHSLPQKSYLIAV